MPKAKPVDPTDISEAREFREEAEATLAQVRAQDLYVARLTERLIQRRLLNHFGDQIQVTFTRGKRA